MAVAHCYARSLEDVERARIEKAVAVINAVYGAPDRLRALAEDVVAHWVNRSAQMVKVMGTPGKALIVGGTREICAGGGRQRACWTCDSEIPTGGYARTP